MNLFTNDVLPNLIDSEVKEHLWFENRYEGGMYSGLENYINQSEPSKSFYSNFNKEELKNKYWKIINDITKSCVEYTTNKEKILYLLELTRLTAMYENIGERADVLSQYGINVALLGKGVCAGQAKYFRNLLLANNIDSKTIRLDLPHDDPTDVIAHESVLVRFDDNKIIIVDPTWYNGDEKELAKFFNERKFVVANIDENNVSKFNVSQKEVDIARERATKFVIDYYGINNIFEDFSMFELSEFDRFLYIIKFIQNNLVISQENEICRSVVVNGREFEIGKILELLLSSNKLLFDIISLGKKSKCLYNISISGEKIIVCPNKIFKKIVIN